MACLRRIARYAAEGEAGLSNRSSRPYTSPTRTAPEVEDRILQLRDRERRGPDWIGAELGVPARTVSRILVRRGAPRLCVLDPMTGEVIPSSKQTATCYERSRPGEPVHMDVKKLGRIPDGGGWRAHGRAASVDHRHKSVPTGFNYVHWLVDDRSRLPRRVTVASASSSTKVDGLPPSRYLVTGPTPARQSKAQSGQSPTAVPMYRRVTETRDGLAAVV